MTEDGMAEENGDVRQVDRVFRPFSKPPVQGATEVRLLPPPGSLSPKIEAKGIPEENKDVSLLDQIEELTKKNKALVDENESLTNNNVKLAGEIGALTRVIVHLQNRIDAIQGS